MNLEREDVDIPQDFKDWSHAKANEFLHNHVDGSIKIFLNKLNARLLEPLEYMMIKESIHPMNMTFGAAHILFTIGEDAKDESAD